MPTLTTLLWLILFFNHLQGDFIIDECKGMVDLVCDKVNEQIAKIAEKKANKTSKEKMFACKLPTETGEYTCSFAYEFNEELLDHGLTNNGIMDNLINNGLALESIFTCFEEIQPSSQNILITSHFYYSRYQVNTLHN